MGTASDIFLSELESFVNAEIADAIEQEKRRLRLGYPDQNKRRAEQRQRVLEAFPAAVCEVIAEKFKAHLPGLSGPAAGLAKLLIKRLREEPGESPYE